MCLNCKGYIIPLLGSKREQESSKLLNLFYTCKDIFDIFTII